MTRCGADHRHVRPVHVSLRHTGRFRVLNAGVRQYCVARKPAAPIFARASSTDDLERQTRREQSPVSRRLLSLGKLLSSTQAGGNRAKLETSRAEDRDQSDLDACATLEESITEGHTSTLSLPGQVVAAVPAVGWFQRHGKRSKSAIIQALLMQW